MPVIDGLEEHIKLLYNGVEGGSGFGLVWSKNSRKNPFWSGTTGPGRRRGQREQSFAER